MENLKIKVSGRKDGDSAQELFFKLGYGFDGCKIKTIQNLEYTSDYYFFAYSHDMDLTHSCDYGVFMNKVHKEITLQELRDMVKPKVKEYLFKYNDQYTFVELSKEDAESNPEQYIEIPDGADCLTSCNNVLIFWKGQDYSFDIEDDKDWIYYADGSMTLDYYSNFYKENGVVILWQRESLNDKIATAEVARQEEKHNHYKKDVSHLNVIDPYRIAVLYNLHPCADHIMKKSLCAGNRGHKDTLRDIQDIIDTAERWKQMVEEDSNEI